MADFSSFAFAVNQLDYVARLEVFRITLQQYATEIEDARGGYANLQAGLVGYAGMTANLPAGGYRITGLANPVDAGDAASKSWVETLALSASIPVTGADTGKVLTNDGASLYWTSVENLLPAMAGHAGKVLINNGTIPSWSAADFFLPAKAGKAGWSLEVDSAATGWTLKQKQDRLTAVTYDNRTALRGMSPVDGDLALVDGLGLFRYQVGVDEGPDDDETAFACGSGFWLLDCPTWDVVEAMQLPRLDGHESRLNSAEVFARKFLHKTETKTAFTLAINSSVTWTSTIAGAAMGAAVIVSPPSDPTINTITLYGRVSARDTVTIYIGNANSAISGGFAAGDWQLVVINQ